MRRAFGVHTPGTRAGCPGPPVEPSHQGRGLGRLLLDFGEAEARRLGLAEVRLYTNALMTDNVAIYTARGYVQTDRRTVDGRDAIFMRKRLEDR